MRLVMLARKIDAAEFDEPWLRVSGHFAGSVEQNAVEGLPEGGFVFQAVGGPIVGDLNRFCPKSLISLDVHLLTEAVVFVHLFAGHRRHQDLQWQIENQLFVANRCVFCISVDLCLQGEIGNLIGKHPIAFWVDKIRRRRVIGVGGGPPCETWTAARWMPGGPKPLRDQARPWGLPFLSRKQDRQVSIGTELLQTIVQLMWEAAIMDGCAWLEHPQVALWARLPSIWRLRALRWLTRLKCTTAVSFDQCTMGALGVKPTTLLLVRLPLFRQLALQQGRMGRCDHGPGAHAALKGREGDGSLFKTARAKVYPPGMNKFLAEAICSYVTEHNLPKAGIFPEHLRCFASEVVGTADIQPDFHG